MRAFSVDGMYASDPGIEYTEIISVELGTVKVPQKISGELCLGNEKRNWQ
jgi:hypothetical protein